jgi:hypothetical protein
MIIKMAKIGTHRDRPFLCFHNQGQAVQDDRRQREDTRLSLQPCRCEHLNHRKPHSLEFPRHFYTLYRKHICQCNLLTRIRRSNITYNVNL